MRQRRDKKTDAPKVVRRSGDISCPVRALREEREPFPTKGGEVVTRRRALPLSPRGRGWLDASAASHVRGPRLGVGRAATVACWAPAYGLEAARQQPFRRPLSP